MNFESTRVKLPETGAYLCRLLRPLTSQIPGLGLVFLIDGQVEVKIRGASYRLAKADIMLLQRCEFVNLLPSVADDKEKNFLLILKIAPEFLSLAFDEKIPVFACGPISAHGGGGGPGDPRRNCLLPRDQRRPCFPGKKPPL